MYPIEGLVLSEVLIDPLELEFPMVVNYYMGAGNRTKSSSRATSAPNHWSLQPLLCSDYKPNPQFFSVYHLCPVSYKQMTPGPVYTVLRTKSRTFCLLDKHSTT